MYKSVLNNRPLTIFISWIICMIQKQTFSQYNIDILCSNTLRPCGKRKDYRSNVTNTRKKIIVSPPLSVVFSN